MVWTNFEVEVVAQVGISFETIRVEFEFDALIGISFEMVYASLIT